MPDEDEIANEHPSSETLSQILDGSDVFVSESEELEIAREIADDILIEEVEQLDQIGKNYY